MRRAVLLGLFCCIATVVEGGGYGPHHQPPPRIPPHSNAPRSLPPNLQQPFYKELPQNFLIASPKPRNNNYHGNPPPPPNYRTLNPHNTYLPPPPQYSPYRQSRSSNPHSNAPQLIASASNTPVLVLKKDHTRPMLASALVAAAVAQKREQQAKQLVLQQQQPTKIPTVIIESPKQQDHLLTSQSQTHQTTSTPVKSPPTTQPKRFEEANSNESPQQPQQQEEQERESRQEREQEEQLTSSLSSQEQSHPLPPTASAERRSFFNSVAQNSALSQQVSGPQGPSSPQRKPKQSSQNPNLIASASSNQQHRPNQHAQNPHNHNNAHRHPHHHHHNNPEDHEEEEQIERITRSNANQYSDGSLQFQYPPPQGNYIAQGPTRVPVKYQQGVIGYKPQQQQRHPQHQQSHYPNHQQQPYKQRIQQSQQTHLSEEPTSEELEELEDAKPDRLTELLQTSKFACGGKKDGYYADDSLNCEVFHYCQDGGKHSWLCPNGFAFHQIHLICVPPSSDNICKQSADYHFVNEYLYKPINEREHAAHNASLKYADRYFPDGYNHGAGDIMLPYHDQDDEEEDGERIQHQHRPHHLQVAPQQQRQHQAQQRPPHNPYANIPIIASPRPPHHSSPRHQQQPPRHQQQHYAHAPPRPTGGFLPIPSTSPRTHHQQLRPQQHQHQPYAQQRSSQPIPNPTKKHPHPTSHATMNHHPNVFFTPESINIPLNQRRPIPNPHAPHHPQIFRPSPQVSKSPVSQTAAMKSPKKKYEDEDYEY